MPAPTTVAGFIAQLPTDRRRDVTRLRALVRKHLPAGYKEMYSSGMIVYAVPLSIYPDTPNKQPLWYAALASQKNYLSLHLMPVYGSPELEKKLREGFKAAGKKLDMGKACVRFRTTDDLALDAIAEIVESVPMDRYVAMAKSARRK